MRSSFKHLVVMPVVVPVVVGVGMLVAGWWVSAAVVFGASVLWARSRAVRTESLLDEALRGTGVMLDTNLREQFQALTPMLRKARLLAGVEQIAGQAYDQLDNIVKAYLAYKNVLGKRFSVTEMTYGRYLKAGEQVFLSALDDLNRAGTQLEALSAMDFESMRSQQRRLKRREVLDEADERELSALEARFAEHDQQMGLVRGWLANNEEALTQMSAATGTLARLRTQQGLAQLESETAMLQLEELSARAKIYSIDKTD
jgi:hypothetical protein